MPFYTAQEKGLLKKVGLEAEYIQMNTGIQPQAIMGGNIDFFPSLSTGISAAVAGLPLVVVLNFYNITPWMLVTSKDINKPQDLIGKKVAISGIRTTGHYLMMAWFKKVEISDQDCRLHHDRWHRIELCISRKRPGCRRCADAPFRRQSGVEGL